MSLNTTKTPPKSDLSGSSSKQQGQLTKHDLKQSLESNQKLNNAKNKLVASLADYAGDQEEVMLSMIILTLQMLSQRAAKDPSQLAPSLKHALLDSQGRARTVLPASDLQPIIDRSIEGNHPQVAPDDLVVTVIRTCFVSQDSPTGSFRSSLSPEEKAKEIVKSDFATPYGGRSCLNLIKHIETMRGRYDPRNDYAPVVPIVQSSGSGKSRAVDQLVRSRFPGVTLCFRPPRNTPEWPPRDSDTADFLRQNKVIQASKARDRFVLALVLSWIEAFFNLSAILLRETREKVFESSTSSPSSCGIASAFYQRTGNDAGDRDNWQDEPSSPSPQPKGRVPGKVDEEADSAIRCREKLLKEIVERAKSNLARIERSDDSQLEDFLEKECIFAARELYREVDLTAEKCDDPNLVFILAFDEASQLILPLASDAKQDRLVTFRRVMHRVGNVSHQPRIFLLLLDTNSNVSFLSGRDALLGSGRLYEKKLSLLPAFTKLAQDVGYSQSTASYRNPNGKLWRDCLGLLPLMGRPLLANKHLKVSSQLETEHKPIVGKVSMYKVKAKLLSREEVFLPNHFLLPVEDHSDSIDQFLAALSQRLPLKFIGCQGIVAVSHLLQRQVSNHLRTLRRLDNNGQFVLTATPSEPLISLAATDLFRQPGQRGNDDHPKSRWGNALKVLAHCRQYFGLTTGLDGEEVACILATLATDLSSFKHHLGSYRASGSEEQMEAWYGGKSLEPITAWEWITTLLGAQKIKSVLDDVSDQGAVGSSDPKPAKRFKVEGESGDLSLETMARSSMINFTHFVTLRGPVSTLSQEFLAHLFVRHAALVGGANQVGWDILIPIYLDQGWKGEDTTFSIKKMSFILVQVKNRNQLVRPGEVAIKAPLLKESQRTSAWPLSHISIFIEMLTTRSDLAGISYRRTLRANHDRFEHFFHVRGLSAFTVVEELPNESINLIHSLLGLQPNEAEKIIDWQEEDPATEEIQSGYFHWMEQDPSQSG